MFLVDLGDEHVLAVLVPVAGGLPQLAVDDLGRVDLAVAARRAAAAHVVLQRRV
jgi:hypothetical protein